MTTPAALTHEDASAQLLDLVYGEAEGAARVALEAHVAGCAQCQAELAALGDTRALLRGTLTADEPPVPALAHAKILEAARAAVAAPAPQRAKAKVAQPSFWERMRGRWTFPTLATVGAVAVVVVTSKMFLDPNRAFEKMEAQRAPAEAELQAPPPAAAPVTRGEGPAQEPSAPSAAPADQPAEVSESIARRRRALEKLRIGSLGARGGERSHSADERLRAAMDRFDGPGHGLGGGSTASGGGLGSLGAGVKRDELAKSVRANAAEKAAAPAPKPAPEPVAAKPAAAPARSYASPPSGWAAEGKASQPSQPKGGAASGAVASAPASPPPVAAQSAPAKRKVQVADDVREADQAPLMEEKAEAESADKSAKKEQRQKDGAPSADALVRKAEQLYAAGRWGEAITAYRELLRRFPEADGAAQWRTRLVQAQREETAVRAKAAPAAR